MRLSLLLATLLCLAGCASVGTGGATNTWSRSMENKRIALERGAGDSGISVLRTDDNQLQVNVPSEFSFER